MLKLNNVTITFENQNILENINLEVKKGEIISIIGPSGSGKSTLIRCMNHMVIPSVGYVSFKDEILTEKNIDEILSAPIDEVIEVFSDHAVIYNKLKCIIDMGIGYLSLGRLSMNLSGGEAQRIKLAKVLGAKAGEHVAIILDEPTAGLHERDIEKLLNIIGTLSRKGETIIAIEHNVEFISQVADCIIDFGVGSGNNGGKPILFENPIDAFSSDGSSLYYS